MGSKVIEQEHDNIVDLELFEGYQSHEDDEFFSDSNEQNNKAKLARLIDCNPFKQITGDHAIQGGINFDKVKNDNDRFKVNVDAQRLYKAKRRALDGLGREHAECFGLLRRYAYIVNVCNPGSAVHIRLQQPEPTFQRFFLSFEAQRVGFLRGCMPFITLDGCHLKRPYGGVLLNVIALDANNGLYPLAFCICEGTVQGISMPILRIHKENGNKKVSRKERECGRWKTEIPPNVSSKVLNASKESRILRMINARDSEYKLFKYTRTYVVKDKISDYIHPSLTKTTFLNTYINMIHPIPDQSRWPQVVAASVIPPPIIRQPGMPKLQRKREQIEKPRETRSGTVVCQVCKQVGHNKRSCSKSNQFNKKVVVVVTLLGTPASRVRKEYRDGAKIFVEAAKRNARDCDLIVFPCKRCINQNFHTTKIVYEHLVINGMDPTYTNWVFHGENPTSSGQNENSSNTFRMYRDALFEDVCNIEPEVEIRDEELTRNVEEAETPLYHGSTKYTKLSAIVVLYKHKATHGLSDKGFDELLGILQDMLP
ncbi:hypothetical protein Ddye_019559 [Dipteronia dyeriana]|uniref:Transposase-associated domain-containing protein n=1 Tax=Dipteronia dyeriana TaxID=168575 RepID=A0AAD9TY08_9ROSI|nr:hypothetical protein Ddye_019559 [Dipteronia dyeriana]